jgi:hypothetical protein
VALKAFGDSSERRYQVCYMRGGGCISQDIRRDLYRSIGCVMCVGRVYFTGDISRVSHITGDIGPFVRATYVHLGRMAAIVLAPSTPRLFDARLRLVMALLLSGIAKFCWCVIRCCQCCQVADVVRCCVVLPCGRQSMMGSSIWQLEGK